MASAGPYASLHIAPDRQPRQYPTTMFFTGRMPFLPPNQQRQSTVGLHVFFKLARSLQRIFRAFWVCIHTHSNYFDFANKNCYPKITRVGSGEGIVLPPQDNKIFLNMRFD